MSAEENSTTLPMLNKLFGDALVNVASLSARTGSYRHTSASSWGQTFQNITSGAADDHDTGLPFSLTTRMAVIAGVVIGLFAVALASYTIHRKCVRNGWKQQYHKALLL